MLIIVAIAAIAILLYTSSQGNDTTSPAEVQQIKTETITIEKIIQQAAPENKVDVPDGERCDHPEREPPGCVPSAIRTGLLKSAAGPPPVLFAKMAP